MFLGRGVLREHWRRVGGCRMFARVSEFAAADGQPPVVLVHGLGVSSRYMVPLAKILARRYAVYSPDLPGFGRSERPREALCPARLAQVLDGWMDAAAIGPALLIGNSMGCQTIVELAAIAPQRLVAAMLLGPTMDTVTALYGISHVRRLLLTQLYEPPLLVPLQAFDYLTNGPIRTIQTFRHALRHRMLERVRLLTAPTLVVRGENDSIVPEIWTRQLMKRLPLGRHATIPGAAHALNYNSPEEVGRLVEGLLEDVGPWRDAGTGE